MEEKVLRHLELDNFIKTFTQYGDRHNALILERLKLKLESQEIVVACCGDVSAGKSSLLNFLSGERDLFPVSPLPSSRNIAEVRPSKQRSVEVWDKSGGHNFPLNLQQQFHALCRDEKLKSLKLFWPIQTDITLIDTPGIKSVARGNELIENEVLLNADLVLYITDYNHVESEVNFTFLTNLQARNIPYILIINKIDKHISLELSLADFRRKLVKALALWKLTPQEVFLTSLMMENHPGCQLKELRRTLLSLVSVRSAVLKSTVNRSVRQVLDLHGRFISAQLEVKRSPHLWVNKHSLDEAQLLGDLEQLTKKIHYLKTLAETAASEIRQEITKLLNNAPIFDFATRQLAKRYLESRQPGFKAGLFAGLARTQTEQNRRLENFYTALTNRSEAHITWHLRKLLTEAPARYNLEGEDYRQQAAQMTAVFEPELLAKTLRSGALLSEEYVMNYTQDVASAIKTFFRKNSLVWVDSLYELAELKARQRLPDLEKRLGFCQKALKSLSQLREIDTMHNTHMQKLLTVVERAFNGCEEFTLHINQQSSVEEPETKQYQPKALSPELNISNYTRTRKGVHPKLWEASQNLMNCVKLINPLPGLALRAESLQQRAHRLANNLLTVTLFGAFSSGKSSLANAMLGDLILPVSPNPTTASVNKIMPPTEEHPHGTIRVKFKSLSELTADVLSNLQACGLAAENLPKALPLMAFLEQRDIPSKLIPHKNFIQAVKTGLPAFEQYLDREITVSYVDFQGLVAEEEKACFVEYIEIYFSCPLTELGIILVDTPGFNSINVRHSEVAFDYIKNADALLYVVYYDNAFSKEDIKFLSQLGKVQDTFQRDKLFFVVNAADLAQSPGELDSILKHMAQNLRAYNFAEPRMFPVSSQLALLAKLSLHRTLPQELSQLYRKRLDLAEDACLPAAATVLRDSGLEDFETSLNSFIGDNLVQLAVEAAQEEISGTLLQVKELLQAARTDLSQRLIQLETYAKCEQAILIDLNRSSNLVEERSLNQEIEELFYYVRQRLLHRAADLFNQCFFPLSQPREQQPKFAIQESIKELLEQIELELEQEVRATGLRVERFFEKSLEFVARRHLAIVGVHEQSLNPLSPQAEAVREFPKIPALSLNMQVYAKLVFLYKGPKDWVEGGGRDKFRDGLLTILGDQVSPLLEDCSSLFKGFWQKLFVRESQRIRENVCAQVSEYYSGLTEIGEKGYDIANLENVSNELAKLTS